MDSPAILDNGLRPSSRHEYIQLIRLPDWGDSVVCEAQQAFAASGPNKTACKYVKEH